MDRRHGWLLALLLLLIAGPTVRADRPCTADNLLLRAPVTGTGVIGEPGLITDGELYADGTPPNAPIAVQFQNTESELIIDAGRAIEVSGFLMQAAGTGTYVVDGSLDGWDWQTVWNVPIADAAGMRLRTHVTDEPATLRYLRIRGGRGSRRVSVSEIRASCAAPERMEPRRVRPSDPSPAPPGRRLSLQTLGWLKLLTATAGALLFAWALVLRRAGRIEFDRKPRERLLIGLALLSVALWTNLGRGNIAGIVHWWDTFHYYVGAKYFGELDYERLYTCATIADDEAGLGPRVRERRMRDLVTNELIDASSALDDPDSCKRHFSERRWNSFTRDVATFRSKMAAPQWDSLFRDHGYNATPVWQAIAGPVANVIPARTIGVAVAIDFVLLALGWAALTWGFGWRATAVAAIWWGTNHFGIYDWVGGSFMRFDWLATAMIGAACLARRRPFAGGVFLSLAALLRVYPATMIGAIGLALVVGVARQRALRIDTSTRRFIAGCAAATLLLITASLLTTGVTSWRQFIGNAAAYVDAQGSNTIGFQSLLAYDHDHRLLVARDPALPDPDQAWSERRRARLDKLAPVKLLGLLGAVAMLAWAVVSGAGRRRPLAEIAIVGVLFVPWLSSPAGYYHALLMLVGLLCVERRAGLGLLFLASSVASQIVFLKFDATLQGDTQSAALSVVVLLLGLGVWLHRALFRDEESRAGSAPTTS